MVGRIPMGLRNCIRTYGARNVCIKAAVECTRADVVAKPSEKKNVTDTEKPNRGRGRLHKRETDISWAATDGGGWV